MENEKKSNFLPLHPKELSDKDFEAYKEEFDFVFSDPCCTNVALSGPYGAGKSSVIGKAKTSYPVKKWITVSLSTFDNLHRSNSAHEGTGKVKLGDGDHGNHGPAKLTNAQSALENNIETEVLRQIVHKIDAKKAPRSRLKAIRDRGWIKSIGIGMYLALCLSAVFLLFSFFALPLSEAGWIPRITTLIVCAVLIAIGIAAISRYGSLSKLFKRLKFMDAELEIQSSHNDSPYDRCADEIVYMLNAAEIDVVVFEDLDRFGSISIFQKMRSLNHLANDARDNTTDEATSIRFFYLVKDGLFAQARDRTKFFDFIIPVIPWIDPSNALDAFKDGLKKIGIKADEEFLFQLSSYIDDPRIVNDIINEASHYGRAILSKRKDNEGDTERLLALLAYKALFPKDFEYLQIGRGYLFETLNGKDRLISRLRSATDGELTELKKESQEIEKQLVINEEDLLLLYALPEIKDDYRWQSLNLSSSTSPKSTIAIARENSEANRLLSQIEDDLNENNEEYKAQLREAKNNAMNRQSAIQEQIEQIKQERAFYEAKSIRELIEISPSADPLFDFAREQLARKEDYEELEMCNVLNNPSYPMVRALVSSGWIDESYRRYISNIYGEALSIADDDFLSAIKQAKPVDVNYEPDSPSEIIRRMDSGMFARKSIRNPWLISELMKSEEAKKIQVFIDRIDQDRDYSYLVDFVNSEFYSPVLFTHLFDNSDSFIDDVIDDRSIEDSKKRMFVRKYMTSSCSHYKKEDKKGKLAQYVNANPYILERDKKAELEKYKNSLRQIDYKTKALDFSESDPGLVRFVYEEKRFTADSSLISGFMAAIHGLEEDPNGTALTTRVFALKNDPIGEVVNANLDYFIKSLVDSCDSTIIDSAETIVNVLNCGSVSSDTAISYIKMLAKASISDLSRIGTYDYKSAILTNEIAISNTNNIVDYYRDSDSEINEILGSFIDKAGIPQDMSFMKLKEFDIDVVSFAGKIVRSEWLSARSVESFLSQYKSGFSYFPVDTLSEEKLMALMRSRVISMNARMLKEIRGRGVLFSAEYALTKFNDYLKIVLPSSEAGEEEKASFDEQEMLCILSADTSIENKLRLIDGFAGPIELRSDYPDELNLEILYNHFSASDLIELPEFYNNANSEFQSKIVSVLAEHVHVVMAESFNISFELARRIGLAIAQNRDSALQFDNWYCKKYGVEQDREAIKVLFHESCLFDYEKLLDGPSAMIPFTSLDNDLLNTLATLNMIGVIDEKVNHENKRRVYSRGYRK